jgi:hypothetical protein
MRDIAAAHQHLSAEIGAIAVHTWGRPDLPPAFTQHRPRRSCVRQYVQKPSAPARRAIA